MDHDEFAYHAQVCAYIRRELETMQNAQKEERRKIRDRNRELISENPFASVYGRADGVIRRNEAGLEEIEAMERRKRILETMLESPYFGRVDFLFDGEREPESFYVGLATVSDPDSGQIFVYDWRAPVSALFYTGEIGRASYRAPAGEIKGEITRIRQYRFQNGELLRFWDAEMQIDDSVLRDVLSGAAAQSMRPIVSTIQREQNRAIRFDEKTNLAVFGPAGSGKTSVGMHRLSWLAYRIQKQEIVPQLMMFTGNEAFRSYVSGVLPALGERNLRSVSFQELCGKYLQGVRIQPALTQTEALLSGDPGRKERIRKRYDPDFLAYVRVNLERAKVRFRDVVLFGEPVVTAEDLSAKFYALPARMSVSKRLETVSAWAESEISNYYLIHKKQLLDRFLRETESGDSYTEAYRLHRERALNSARLMVRNAANADPVGLLSYFYASYYGDARGAGEIRERAENGRIWYEDAIVMLYIAVRMQGAAGSPDHVLVDEAQDLSPLHHLIIRELYPKAVFTVLADDRQGIVPDVNTSESALVEFYGAVRTELLRSYRSTKQIGEYAKRFLPAERADYEIFSREGDEPFAYRTANPLAETVRILREEPENVKTICMILPDAAEAASFYYRLRDYVPEAELIQTEGKPLSGRVICMPAALTKGLEFDSVILPFADALQKDRRLAYLTATRALHRLHLIRGMDENGKN